MPPRAGAPAPDIGRLERLRDRSLGLDPPPLLRSSQDAARFLERVGIALRYGAGSGLPLASMYHAASGPDRDKTALVHAIEVTNGVIGTAAGIEVNVIADRLCLVHRAVVPYVYALVRRERDVDDLSGLSLDARRAYQLIREQRETTVGRLRKHLGLAARPKNDPAHDALSELQRALLVDRGPFEVRRSGVPYLSKEGDPYHLFHAVHPELVKGSRRSIPGAAAGLLRGYLAGAVFCSIGKMKVMFRLLLRPEEVDRAVADLASGGAIVMHDRIRPPIVTWNVTSSSRTRSGSPD